MIAESTIMKCIIKKTQQYLFAIALFIIGMSVAMGAWWGLVGEWNPDQLAFGNLDTRYIIPKPYSYLRPPLVSYFHLYFSEIPIKRIGVVIHASQSLTVHLALVWSKHLAASIYVLSVLLFYLITRKFIHNSIYAKLFTIIFGSSAGLIAYGHFLTADIPLMFCMICTLTCILHVSSNPSLKNYFIAGTMCGITSAVKYNGLILVSPLLLVFFLSSLKPFTAEEKLRMPKRNIDGFQIIQYLLLRVGMLVVLLMCVAFGFLL